MCDSNIRNSKSFKLIQPKSIVLFKCFNPRGERKIAAWLNSPTIS